MRIIALSGSAASLPSLKMLHRESFLSAVISATPALGTDTTDIETWATTQGIPCWQADASKLDAELTELIKETTVDLILVFGYPFKVTSELLLKVKHGAWNVHYSLHPEQKGSITIHQLADTARQSKVLQQCDINLMPIEEAGSPIHQLSLYSVGLLQNALSKLSTQPESKFKVTG